MSKISPLRAGLCALSGFLALAALSPAQARPPAKAVRASAQQTSAGMRANAEKGYEKSLLGIHILQSYKVVLAKLGQPHRLFRGDEQLEIRYEPDAKGVPTGGVVDIVSIGDIKEITPGNTPAAPNSDENPEDPTQTDPTAPTSSGGFNGAGPNGGSQEKQPETFGQAGGFAWVYLNRRDKQAYFFAFNRQGRVVLMAELGLGTGSPTARGINLGSPLQNVYERYGWPDTVQETKDNMQLFYDIKHHCQFDVTNNKVTGIVVVLSEGLKLAIRKPGGGSGGGAPGGAPPSGGSSGAARRPGVGGNGG